MSRNTSYRGGYKSNFGKFNRNNSYNEVPDQIIEIGEYSHGCEGDIIVNASIDKIPYDRSFIFLQNKVAIGKVDEIFGPISNYYFSIKLNAGYNSESFKKGQKLFIDSSKLLPLSRFLPQPAGSKTSEVGKSPHNRQNFASQRGKFGGGRGRFTNRGRGNRVRGGFRGRR